MKTLIEQAVDVTEQMLEHAQHQQWNELQQLQPQQSALIQQIKLEAPKTPLSDSTTIETGREMLTRIKQINRQISVLAEAQKTDALQHQKVLNKGQKMKNMYGQNSRNRF